MDAWKDEGSFALRFEKNEKKTRTLLDKPHLWQSTVRFCVLGRGLSFTLYHRASVPISLERLELFECPFDTMTATFVMLTTTALKAMRYKATRTSSWLA